MTTDVCVYLLSLVEHLDGSRCRSNFHVFLHQRAQGHAVEVARRRRCGSQRRLASVYSLAHASQNAGRNARTLRSTAANTLARDPSRFRNLAVPLVQPLEQLADCICSDLRTEKTSGGAGQQIVIERSNKLARRISTLALSFG